uniref:Arm DNA-binding domain-containing protein n=1 Tax=Providencia stuartii TaxID=588 RepID=UPI002AA0C436
MGSQKQAEYSLPRGVTIRNNKTKQTIIITFTYKGVLCREPLSRLTVDNKNIKYAERLLAEIQNNIE